MSDHEQGSDDPLYTDPTYAWHVALLDVGGMAWFYVDVDEVTARDGFRECVAAGARQVFLVHGTTIIDRHHRVPRS